MPRRKPKDPERSPDLPHNWIERHLTRLEAFAYCDPMDLPTWDYRRARLTGPGQYEDVDETWREIHLGETWGGADITAFFRRVLVIPASHAGPDAALDLWLDGGETQLRIDGYPWQGLDWYRSLVPIGEFAQAGRRIELELEAFVINYPYDERRHDERDHHRFERARLVRRDREIEAFLADARLVLSAYLSHYRNDDDPELEAFLLHFLEAACRMIGPQLDNQEAARRAATRAHRILREDVFAGNGFRRPGLISVCAHSHLDIVYLWPIKETLRKNCRTITNQLNLMREYPDYRFSYSQPYLYEQLQEMYPDVFEEVRARVREGRWEVIGAMYVEPDGNLLGPESIVRQLLFGKRYIRETFGIDAQTCWLPDVFGVMYTLPQILQKAGVKYFTTAKLNIWNDTNVFPYDTFRWRGPDGSEVIAHFPPTHFAQEYGVENLRRQWRDFREKQTTGENLFIYGWGDGGGGPTREMVETCLRTDGFPGLPRTQIEFAEDFFRRQEAKRAHLPVWDDELYLEAHRGTYTTKGALKRLNRKAEVLYRDAEILSALAWLHGGSRVQERLNAGWKLLLLNQFHDTLPGTHKPAGVPDILRDYRDAYVIGESVREDALTYLTQRIAPPAADGRDLVIFNTLAWPRGALVATDRGPDATAVRLADDTAIPVQHHDGRTWFRAPGVPSLGWTVAVLEDALPLRPEATARFDDNRIETAHYRIELDATGKLTAIHDKINDRAVLAEPGNVFQLFEDDPGHKFGAWDIAYHFEEHRYPVQQQGSWELIANGPVFAVFRSRWQALNSTIEQEMWLYADDPRIDFHTRADWRDSRKLLKVAFPLALRTRTATYDLPFGNIERPTHRNTSWEQAKFEVCGHKWADLSEGNYGVALINDCKYGYDAREHVLRLSLLRSPVRPDGQSDLGAHQFTYSLLPHAGNWRQAQVDRRAYELNMPALVRGLDRVDSQGDATLPVVYSLLENAAQSIIVETLKQAESGDGVILRTFESHGNHVSATFATAGQLTAVRETNLLEEEMMGVSLTDCHHFDAAYTPYEIKTHRLEFARSKAPQP